MILAYKAIQGAIHIGHGKILLLYLSDLLAVAQCLHSLDGSSGRKGVCR